MTLRELNEEIKICRKCRLWQGAKNAVPGEGPSCATVMLVGQNPGAEEDETGRPFVGRAGKFLNKVLAQNGFDRTNFFITNVVKHATPKNRKPFQDEIGACLPYLTSQFQTTKPNIVLLMGAVAWMAPRIKGVKYIKTVHPSAAMRFTKMRNRFSEDFAALRKAMEC